MSLKIGTYMLRHSLVVWRYEDTNETPTYRRHERSIIRRPGHKQQPVEYSAYAGDVIHVTDNFEVAGVMMAMVKFQDVATRQEMQWLIPDAELQELVEPHEDL